jgi:DnaJ domain
MGIPERLYNIGKGYVGQIRDRIDDELTDRERAVAELSGEAGADAPPAVGSDPDALFARAEAKIAAARQSLAAQKEITPPSANTTVSTDAEARLRADLRTEGATREAKHLEDYVILGVPAGSDLSTIESRYEELIRRCNPDRFPKNSDEQKKAQEILDRVNAAHDSLKKQLDPTQNRFDKLEF